MCAATSLIHDSEAMWLRESEAVGVKTEFKGKLYSIRKRKIFNIIREFLSPGRTLLS